MLSVRRAEAANEAALGMNVEDEGDPRAAGPRAAAEHRAGGHHRAIDRALQRVGREQVLGPDEAGHDGGARRGAQEAHHHRRDGRGVDDPGAVGRGGEQEGEGERRAGEVSRDEQRLAREVVGQHAGQRPDDEAWEETSPAEGGSSAHLILVANCSSRDRRGHELGEARVAGLSSGRVVQPASHVHQVDRGSGQHMGEGGSFQTHVARATHPMGAHALSRGSPRCQPVGPIRRRTPAGVRASAAPAGPDRAPWAAR